MIVISDTSALIVLSKMNRLEILHFLFGNVVIPQAVQNELQDPDGSIRSPNIRIDQLNWLTIQTPQFITTYQGLNPGETEAIALAKELHANLLIMDEKAGRKIAAREGIETVGTIGILEMAAESGLIDLASSFQQLKDLKFHVTTRLLDSRLLAFQKLQIAKQKPDN
jgi:predicted nucleic acid-binding protein